MGGMLQMLMGLLPMIMGLFGNMFKGNNQQDGYSRRDHHRGEFDRHGRGGYDRDLSRNSVWHQASYGGHQPYGPGYHGGRPGGLGHYNPYPGPGRPYIQPTAYPTRLYGPGGR